VVSKQVTLEIPGFDGLVTRRAVTGVALAAAGWGVWSLLGIVSAWTSIVTGTVLLAAAATLWALRPEPEPALYHGAGYAAPIVDYPTHYAEEPEYQAPRYDAPLAAEPEPAQQPTVPQEPRPQPQSYQRFDDLLEG